MQFAATAEIMTAEAREEQWKQAQLFPIRFARWLGFAMLTLLVQVFELVAELVKALSSGLKTSGWIMSSTLVCIIGVFCRALVIAVN